MLQKWTEPSGTLIGSGFVVIKMNSCKLLCWKWRLLTERIWLGMNTSAVALVFKKHVVCLGGYQNQTNFQNTKEQNVVRSITILSAITGHFSVLSLNKHYICLFLFFFAFSFLIQPAGISVKVIFNFSWRLVDFYNEVTTLCDKFEVKVTLNVLAICHKLTAPSAYSTDSIVMTG